MTPADRVAPGPGSGWTAGQYRAWRLLLGLLLAAAAWAGFPPPARHLAAGLALLQLAGGLCLAAGRLDRLAAGGLVVVIWLQTLLAADSAALPAATTAWAPLALHLLAPPLPGGRGRPEVRWALPEGLQAAAWLLVPVGIALGPAGIPEHPLAALGVLLPVLALAARPHLRPAAFLLGAAGLALSALLRGPPTAAWALGACAWLLLLDPGWIPPARPLARVLVFYDGGCGLCHRAVRFAAAEDRRPVPLRFAPLWGDTFQEALPADARAGLPRSLVLQAGGRLHTRSGATARLLQLLGGCWRPLGRLLLLVPRPVRDAAYDAVARMRHRLIRSPEAACPLLPGYLMDRFLP